MPAIHARNEALLARAQDGDTRAEDQLIRNNLRLAHHVARKFIRRCRFQLEYDDLVSECLLGLLSAVRRFDPEAGFAFSTYAVMAMQNHCQRAIAAADLIRRPTSAQAAGVEAVPVLSLDYPIGEDEEDRLGDLLPAPDDTERSSVGEVWMEQTLSRLSARERVAVELYVLDEQPNRDVGRALGLSAEGGRRLVKRGLGRLRAREVAAA